jgi:CRISPR-associated endonuclease Cas3-HD
VGKSFYGYWGKSGRYGGSVHLLPYHGLDVAAVGEVLLRADNALRRRLATATGLREEAFLGVTRFFLAAHDLGKFSERFQSKCPEAMKQLGSTAHRTGPCDRHDHLGWRLWCEAVRPLAASGHLGPGRGRKWLRYWNTWARAFLGHHGLPPALAIDLSKPAGPYRAGVNQINLPEYRRYIADFAALARAVRDGQPLHVAPDEDLLVHEALIRASGM